MTREAVPVTERGGGGLCEGGGCVRGGLCEGGLCEGTGRLSMKDQYGDQWKSTRIVRGGVI